MSRGLRLIFMAYKSQSQIVLGTQNNNISSSTDDLLFNKEKYLELFPGYRLGVSFWKFEENPFLLKLIKFTRKYLLNECMSLSGDVNMLS